jgi:peptidase E
MTTPRIVASSGGFVSTPGLWGVMRPGGIMRRALELTGKERPRVLLVMTASGDDSSYLSMMYSALSSSSCDVDHLSLFTQPNRPVDEAVGRADLVWVGGGSVANLLALWRLHGVDSAMREAWERGTVLGGVSAGSICWHTGGPTDSFGAQLQPVTNALGFLPYGNGVHYDSEEQRRPLLQRLVGDGTLPTSYATDDHVAIVYEGTEPVEVVTDDPVDPASGPAAYRIALVDAVAQETRLAPGPITDLSTEQPSR